MEYMLAFHPGTGIGGHKREIFAAVVTYQDDTCHGKSRIPFIHAGRMQGVLHNSLHHL